MTETSDSPTSSADPSSAAAAPASPAPTGVARIVRLPSPGATAVLAGAMLALGVAVGAAIGPAPDASFAGASRIASLLPPLGALATGTASHSSTASAKPAAAIPQTTPAPAVPPSPRANSSGNASTTSTSTSSTQNTSTPSFTPTSTGVGGATKALPAVTHVWLIELSGTTFADALAQPSAAPYIDGQAVPAGALLNGWSGLDASTFAGDAALIAGTPPQVFETIVQPACPEGAPGAQCVAGTPGGLAAADEFLKGSLSTITGTAAYHTNGLIVVTFGAIVPASATGLPSGAAAATLPSEPPAGVLLISPFASAGTRPTATFNPASARQSLEKLLHQ